MFALYEAATRQSSKNAAFGWLRSCFSCYSSFLKLLVFKQKTLQWLKPQHSEQVSGCFRMCLVRIKPSLLNPYLLICRLLIAFSEQFLILLLAKEAEFLVWSLLPLPQEPWTVCLKVKQPGSAAVWYPPVVFRAKHLLRSPRWGFWKSFQRPRGSGRRPLGWGLFFWCLCGFGSWLLWHRSGTCMNMYFFKASKEKNITI